MLINYISGIFILSPNVLDEEKFFPFIVKLKKKQNPKPNKKHPHTTNHCIFPKLIKCSLETTVQPSKNINT